MACGFTSRSLSFALIASTPSSRSPIESAPSCRSKRGRLYFAGRLLTRARLARSARRLQQNATSPPFVKTAPQRRSTKIGTSPPNKRASRPPFTQENLRETAHRLGSADHLGQGEKTIHIARIATPTAMSGRLPPVISQRSQDPLSNNA